jgi:DNA polymerase-3 subunit beta
MKATIERATLLKSLGHVQSVVERRNTIPDPVERADRGARGRLDPADGNRTSTCRSIESVPANVSQPGADDAFRPTPCFDIVRKLPEGQPGRA